jgi:hypothetical protein
MNLYDWIAPILKDRGVRACIRKPTLIQLSKLIYGCLR